MIGASDDRHAADALADCRQRQTAACLASKTQPMNTTPPLTPAAHCPTTKWRCSHRRDAGCHGQQQQQQQQQQGHAFSELRAVPSCNRRTAVGCVGSTSQPPAGANISAENGIVPTSTRSAADSALTSS